MCNQLPSGSISTASQILGFSGRAWLTQRGVWVGSRAEHLLSPGRCQETGISVTLRPLHSSFVCCIIFGSATLTNTLDTHSDMEREHFSHAAMPYVAEGIYYGWALGVLFDCEERKKKKNEKDICVSCAFHHLLPPTPTHTHTFIALPRACGLASTSSCACHIYYQKPGTSWHLLIGECCWVFVR